MEILDKVYVHEGNTVYPGIIVNQVADAYIVLKFDTVIWRRVVCMKESLSERTDDFGKFMLEVRKKFLNVPVKFEMPQFT